MGLIQNLKNKTTEKALQKAGMNDLTKIIKNIGDIFEVIKKDMITLNEKMENIQDNEREVEQHLIQIKNDIEKIKQDVEEIKNNQD